MTELGVEALKTLVTVTITGILGYLGYRIIEARKMISFAAKDYDFGPALLWNLFMGRNYPSEDVIQMACSVQFFSSKSERTGLHDFRIEFCRSTYMGLIPELAIKDDIHMNWDTKDKFSILNTVELPSREFVSFSLRVFLDRELWPRLKPCDFVQLACMTPEGKTLNFRIGPIRFPAMPPEGIRGLCKLFTRGRKGHFSRTHCRGQLLRSECHFST